MSVYLTAALLGAMAGASMLDPGPLVRRPTARRFRLWQTFDRRHVEKARARRRRRNEIARASRRRNR